MDDAAARIALAKTIVSDVFAAARLVIKCRRLLAYESVDQRILRTMCVRLAAIAEQHSETAHVRTENQQPADLSIDAIRLALEEINRDIERFALNLGTTIRAMNASEIDFTELERRVTRLMREAMANIAARMDDVLCA